MAGRTVVAVTLVSPITPNQPEPISFNGFIHQAPNSKGAVTASAELLGFFALRLVSNGNWTLNITNRMFLRFDFCRPQTKLREGNVFTSVSYSFCPQGGGVGCIPAYNGKRDVLQPSLGRHPPGRQPPKANHPPPWPLKRVVCIILECILVV